MCKFILLPSSFHICTYLLEVKVNRQQSGCLSCNLSQARKREREVNTAWHALCHTIKRLLVRGPDLHQKNIQPQSVKFKPLDKIWPGHGLISSSRSVSLRLHWCWTSVEEFFWHWSSSVVLRYHGTAGWKQVSPGSEDWIWILWWHLFRNKYFYPWRR